MPAARVIPCIACAFGVLTLPGPSQLPSAFDYPDEIRALDSPEVEILRRNTETHFRALLDDEAGALLDHLCSAAWALRGSDALQAGRSLEAAAQQLAMLKQRYSSGRPVPVAVVLEVADHAPGSEEEIVDLFAASKALLSREKAFPAREVLVRLASEIRIRMSYLRPESYEEVITKVTALRASGDPAGAARILEDWRSGIETVEYVAPIPIGQALLKLDEAGQAGSAIERIASLTEAERQVRRAFRLGYLDESKLEALGKQFVQARSAAAGPGTERPDLAVIRQALLGCRLLDSHGAGRGPSSNR
jgi:hypothetical protein